MRAGKAGAVIVAAGKGTRMKSSTSKQFLHIHHKPVIVHTIETFCAIDSIAELVVVVGQSDRPTMEQLLEQYRLSSRVKLAVGGGERQVSVYNGLQALSDEVEWVLVHDGVRPFVTVRLVQDCLAAAKEYGAAAAALPVKDTIKVAAGNVIEHTPDRKSLWAVQTPQAFRRSVLLAAHRQAEADGFFATDDAMLLERAGEKVQLVPGEEMNLKVTTPEDLAYLEWKLQRRSEESQTERGETNMIKVGQGFDVHQLVEGRPCIIGGVEIPFEKGLLGHSDADVLLHAVTDAILGAIGEGDIGTHFPDTDQAYKDADSAQLLAKVWQLVKESGYQLGNIDATIIAQSPKMAPYIEEMKQRIADLLEASLKQVNVKATTTEKLGFTGRGEGIAAQAVVALVKNML